jgi:deazaflavin-dependent oxidoreductase (nitroreductase family)
MTTPSGGRREWVQEHMDRYLATNGKDGHLWRNGIPTLLLTTTGRKSGNATTTPLIYGRDGDRYMVVGSRGGAPTHPQWYLNLSADSSVQIQVEAEKFSASARTASPDEKPRLWEIMAQVYPSYNEYQEKTDRDIPVIILERTA